MTARILESVKGANLKLRAFLHNAEEALAGRRIFGVDELRAAQEPVSDVGAVLNEATQSRSTFPELDSELTAYSQNLKQRKRFSIESESSSWHDA